MGSFFQLLVSFSIYFFNVLKVLKRLYKYFTSLVMFIPRYLWVYSERNAWFFFSIYLALVYRKASDFCVPILYFATWLKVFISCKSFGFLVCIESCHLQINILRFLLFFFVFPYLFQLSCCSSEDFKCYVEQALRVWPSSSYS